MEEEGKKNFASPVVVVEEEEQEEEYSSSPETRIYRLLFLTFHVFVVFSFVFALIKEDLTYHITKAQHGWFIKMAEIAKTAFLRFYTTLSLYCFSPNS